jgi:hypothetical protein
MRSPRSQASARRSSSTNRGRARGDAGRAGRRSGRPRGAVAREISKKFEECVTGTLTHLAALCRCAAQRGDRRRRRPAGRGGAGQRQDADALLREALTRLPAAKAASEVAKATGLQKARPLCPRARDEGMRDRRPPRTRGRDRRDGAAWWLRLKGWRILARRVRTPAGEVDLIARKGNLVAFVEVKTARDGGRAGFRDRPAAARARGRGGRISDAALCRRATTSAST